MPNVQRTYTPVDGSLYVERPLATPEELGQALERAQRGFLTWRKAPLSERIAGVNAFDEERARSVLASMQRTREFVASLAKESSGE